MKITPIHSCRICNGADLKPVFNLGTQSLTGTFPRPGEELPTGPVELVRCVGCGLVQLAHDYDQSVLYGDNYGYRSGLNESMAAHLRDKVAALMQRRPLASGDTVIDIGSNDGTLLSAYPRSLMRVGFDPTGNKFKEYYPEGVVLVPELFHQTCSERAGIITSIAMFYDLPQPGRFVEDVAAMLAPDGIWHFEQSYLPSMLRTGSYDTVVVEHLEYYSLSVVKMLLESRGLRIMDVQTNNINGGSFAVTACHNHARFQTNHAVIDWMLAGEQAMGLDSSRVYAEFEARAMQQRQSLVSLIRGLVADGRVVAGLGASTKGNCLLQYCGFTKDDIAAIGDVNREKHGRHTPGTGIPIVSEDLVRAMKPDYMLAPIWHFRPGLMARERAYLAGGGRIIFPFPDVEIAS